MGQRKERRKDSEKRKIKKDAERYKEEVVHTQQMEGKREESKGQKKE